MTKSLLLHQNKKLHYGTKNGEIITSPFLTLPTESGVSLPYSDEGADIMSHKMLSKRLSVVKLANAANKIECVEVTAQAKKLLAQ